MLNMAIYGHCCTGIGVVNDKALNISVNPILIILSPFVVVGYTGARITNLIWFYPLGGFFLGPAVDLPLFLAVISPDEYAPRLLQSP